MLYSMHSVTVQRSKFCELSHYILQYNSLLRMSCVVWGWGGVGVVGWMGSSNVFQVLLLLIFLNKALFINIIKLHNTLFRGLMSHV